MVGVDKKILDEAEKAWQRRMSLREALEGLRKHPYEIRFDPSFEEELRRFPSKTPVLGEFITAEPWTRLYPVGINPFMRFETPPPEDKLNISVKRRKITFNFNN